MMGIPQHKFRTTELDPKILSMNFKVLTNWHVITGAPSCGKSTLIDLLAEKGYQTVPECARQYMEKEVASGRSIEDVHEKGDDLQRAIEGMQLGIEARLQANDIIFLDGSVTGSLSWYRIFGMNPNEILLDCFEYRYASVFVLDRLPLHLNG